MKPLVTVTHQFLFIGNPLCCLGPKIGMWISGSNTVTANGLPIVRAFVDKGMVPGCCCPIAMPITPINNLIINGSPAFPLLGKVLSPCGMGTAIAGVSTILG